VARAHLIWTKPRPGIPPGEIVSKANTAVEAYFDARPGPSMSL